MTTNGHPVKSRLFLAVFTCLAWGCPVSASGVAPQVLSPSVNPKVPVRQSPEQDGVEPSRKLLIAMNTMIPFEVIGSDLESAVQGIASTFLTGTTEETLAKLKEVRARRDDFPPPALLMANMLYTIGNRDQGRQWLEKATVDHPEHPAAYIGFARFSVTDKRIADAEAMLEKVGRLVEAGSWTDAQTKMFRVEYLDVLTDVDIQRQRLEQARASLLELEQLLPENNKVPIRLAQVEFDLDNVDSSIEYLQKAGTMNPSLRVPEVIISEWFSKKKNPGQSEKWMSLAASQYPEDGNVQLDFARWLLKNEQIPEAREAVLKAEELGANPYVVEYLKGQVSFSRRDYDMAERHFEKLVRQKPRDADATNMLALSLIENEAAEKQGFAVEMALLNQRLYPRSPTALATLGWVYYRTGKRAEAEDAFRQVVASNALGPASAFFVATYLNERGDFAGAKRLLEQALGSEEYFMYRGSAEELLANVTNKIPPAETPAADSGSPESAQDNGENR